MNRETLALAREDWAWSHTSGTRRPHDMPESGDDLIALAFGCHRQTRQETSMTIEDARILAARIPDAAVIIKGIDDAMVMWAANDWASLRYLIHLNA